MVLLALTELAAEVAIWTLKKTVTYSWRGFWWGISKFRGTHDDTSAVDDSNDQMVSAQLRETVQKLQRQVEQQEEELAKLKTNF